MNCNKAKYIANKNITYGEKEIFKEFITLAKQGNGSYKCTDSWDWTLPMALNMFNFLYFSQI